MVKSGDIVTMALSKGRILEDTLPFLENMGIELIDDPEKSRKLIMRLPIQDCGLLLCVLVMFRLMFKGVPQT